MSSSVSHFLGRNQKQVQLWVDEASKVKNFAKNCVLTWDTGDDPEQEMFVASMYNDALDEIEAFLEYLAVIDCECSNGMSHIEIYTPTGPLVVEDGMVLHSDPSICKYDFDSYMEDSMIFLPFGRMSRFVYKLLMSVKDNPVEIFYDVISQHIKREHHLLALRDEKNADAILSKAILEFYDITDSLNIYRLDGIIRDIDEFWERGRKHEFYRP